MKRVLEKLTAVLLVAVLLAPLLQLQKAAADNLTTDGFTGSTLNGTWLSGGTPNSACLTASMSSGGGIPGCDTETAIDTDGNGALRLTSNLANQAGFVINQTPISTSNGLQISFDMYQYNGTGADGIAFFLIDGSQNPSQPGAFGGSLGYSNNNTGTAGIVGGYVGVGFDVFGNFSSSNFGTGGPGARGNTITVRGSQATGYKYVTRADASGLMANNAATLRTNARRHVVISISTGNVMTVYVDYGSGLVKELSGINLNTINGAGSLPASLKFGFSASTGGSNDIHEINNLSVDTLAPNVTANASQIGTWHQGQQNVSYTITAQNDPGAEKTSDTINVKDVISTPLTITGISGSGWTCDYANVHVPECSRPGSGANALSPGQSLPVITVYGTVSDNSPTVISHNTIVQTTNNYNPNGPNNYAYFNVAASDNDGSNYMTESAAPNSGDANNDGTPDGDQANVSSFVNPVTNSYAVLAVTGGCNQNVNPIVRDVSANSTSDADYVYPAGMMNFSTTCVSNGATATITQYYYGDYDVSKFVARKYDMAAHTYTNIPNATLSAVTIGGLPALKMTYTVKDGGPLDADGLANGTIVDPAGPALKYVPPLVTAVNASQVGASPTAPNTGLGVYQDNVMRTALVLTGVLLAVSISAGIARRRYRQSV